jgi:hypothetical protein
MNIKNINSLALLMLLLNIFSINAAQPNQAPLLGQSINGESNQRRTYDCNGWVTNVWQNHKSLLIGCGVLLVGGIALVISDVIPKGSSSSHTNSTLPAVAPHIYQPTPLSLPTTNQIRLQQKVKPPVKQKNPVKFKRRYR